MRNIKRSKVARRYQFSKWVRIYGLLMLFVLTVIVTPFIVLPIIGTSHELLCIPIIGIDILFVVIWCLTPEYENIEQCQKLMSMRAYRKCERKNRKWLI